MLQPRKTAIFGRQSSDIGQRAGYPKAMRLAAVKASKSSKASVSEVAAMFNISSSTVSTWRRDAGVQGAVPAGLARFQATAAHAKSHNTPKIQADGTIKFQGTTYKAI